MKLKTTAIALGLATVAVAAVPRLGSVAHRAMPLSSELQQRTLQQSPASKTGAFSNVATARKVNNGMQKSIGYNSSQLNEITKMGELQLILEEDFSLLDGIGSIDAPDMKTKLEMEWGEGKDYTLPYTNFNRNYTHQPDWGAGNCFPAGGCVYFNCKNEGDQAKVNTPMLDVSANGGLCVVEFKAKSKSGVYKGLLLQTAETNNMAPEWRFYDDPLMYEVGEEWETFYGVFSGAGPYTIFNLVGVTQGEVYVDDIKVYRMKPYAGIPEVKAHTNYTRNGFTANWKAVEGAETYLFSLWTLQDDGSQALIYDDEAVQGTSFDIPMPAEGDDFYYSVKSVNGENVSYPSKVHNVFDIDAPELYAPEISGNQQFTGYWEDMMLASGYSYWVYSERTAQQDGEFVVTDEDFTGVARPDGTKTDFTIENPSDLSLAHWYPTEIKQRGWLGKHYAPYKDFICIDGWWYSAAGQDACFLSPDLDFSKNGGKFTLSAKLAGREGFNNAYWDDPSQPEYVTTQACAALFVYDEEFGDYRQVELIYPDREVTGQWQQFTFNFTKGGNQSIVGIFAVAGYDNLYIDDLKITQYYKQGETLLDPFYMHPWSYTEVAEDPTSQLISIPDRNTGGMIYHKVSAARAQTEMNPWTGEREVTRLVEGKFSPLTEVMETEFNSLVSLPGLQASAVLDHGTLKVLNPARAAVAVYGIDGRLVARLGNASSLSAAVAPGAYIVKVGNTTLKVAGK